MSKINKTTLFIIISLFFTLSVYSQGIMHYVKLTADDTKKERFDRVVIDIKSDQWLKTPPGIKTQPYSIGVSAFLYKDVPLSKNSNIALAYGIGLSSDNIHHNGTIYTTHKDGKSFTRIVPMANSFKTKRNKLTLTYLEVPFELRFRTMNKRSGEKRKFNFRFYPGFKAGYMLGNHTKLVTNNKKIKVYRTPNTLDYRYGPTLRIGFNKVSFIAFYSLTGIFEKGKGNELNTFSIGISWMRF